MHRYLKVIFFITAAAVCLFSFSVSASQPVEQGILFSAYCESTEDIETAIQSGASFVSFGGELTLSQAVTASDGRATLIVDADSVEQAEEKHAEALSLDTQCEILYRIGEGARKVTEWAKNKNGSVKIIGYYKGNIYPIAVSAISKYAALADDAVVQMQTNNQDGVILHDSVTSFFTKNGVSGMFSTVDSAKSAKRTDLSLIHI